VSPRQVPEIAVLTALVQCGRQPPRDVRRWIRQRRLFSWRVEARDVYATIARLEVDGLVSVELVRLDNVRQTRQYQLTASGLDVVAAVPAQVLTPALRVTAASRSTEDPKAGDRVDRSRLEASLDLVALAALIADRHPGQAELAYELRECQRQQRSALDALGGGRRRAQQLPGRVVSGSRAGPVPGGRRCADPRTRSQRRETR